MIPTAVIDASATLAWLFDESEEAARFEERLGSATFSAPWLWRIEVVNAVLVKERRGLISQAQSARLFRSLDALDIEIALEPMDRPLERLASVARPHQLTAYDAVYLELAMTLSIPLYTLDKNLQQAALRSGVNLFGFHSGD